MRIIYSALSAGLVWGVFILIRQTIAGMRREAKPRNLIICICIYGVIGLFMLGTGIYGIAVGMVDAVGGMMAVGLVCSGLAFGLIWKNYVKKADPAETANATESAVDPSPTADVSPESKSDSKEWMCPECGNFNKSYSRSCICGAKKPDQR